LGDARVIWAPASLKRRCEFLKPEAGLATRIAELVVRSQNHQDFHNAILSLVVDGVVRATVLAARWIMVGKLRRERARSSPGESIGIALLCDRTVLCRERFDGFVLRHRDETTITTRDGAVL
jgi:hypothetical protein